MGKNICHSLNNPKLMSYGFGKNRKLATLSFFVRSKIIRLCVYDSLYRGVFEVF